MAEGTRVRDPIHNFISLTEDECKLIATPLLQRLRRIRQLAMASLVYPGALHTRFDHTLGVCHVAASMAQQLKLEPDETSLVRLAALLHDLGHGPFSHVSENVLEKYAFRGSLQGDQKKEKIHEVITSHLINHDRAIVGLIGEDRCSRIVRLLTSGYGQPVLKSIVSGPLDADKQDYLLRDSYFCGVPYGVFDLHQLHRSLALNGLDDEKDLAVSEDGVRALEQFVLAKYYLTANVYRHQVRIITDQMIVRAIVLGIDEDGIEPLRRVYAFENSNDFVSQYVGWDDSRLILEFGSSDETLCGQLFQRLQSRRLHKKVYSKRLQDYQDPEIRAKLLAIGNPANDDFRKKVEVAVATSLTKELGLNAVEARFVIVHGFNIQSVKVSSRNDEASIMVNAEPTPTPFEEHSALFRSIKENYADGSIEVYAPIQWETRSERSRIRNLLREPIDSAITSLTRDEIEREKLAEETRDQDVRPGSDECTSGIPVKLDTAREEAIPDAGAVKNADSQGGQG